MFMKPSHVIMMFLISSIVLAGGNDKSIDWDGIKHQPGANVPGISPSKTYRYFDYTSNKTVFYLQVIKDNITSVNVVWRNGFDKNDNYLEMSLSDCCVDNTLYEYWYAELTKQNSSNLYYVFQIKYGDDTDWAGPGGAGLNKVVHENQPTISANWWTFDDTPLAVELLSFVGDYSDYQVELRWETIREINNYGFNIERSINKQDWIKIGFNEGLKNNYTLREYAYVDRDILFGTYYYRLRQINTDGTFVFSPIVEVEAGELPEEIVLEQNYPNPFNPITMIRFAVIERTHVDLSVYNIIGDKIMTLFNDIANDGRVYEVTFDATGLASGIYFYKLSTAKDVEIKKMILMK